MTTDAGLAIDKLRRAAEECAWLIDRGYEPADVLRLVGAQHALTASDFDLIERGISSDAQYKHRVLHELEREDIVRGVVSVDAMDVLGVVEAALTDEPVLVRLEGTMCRVSSARDGYEPGDGMSSALERVYRTLRALRPKLVRWHVPTSEAGDRVAAALGELSDKPPSELVRHQDVVAALKKKPMVASGDARVVDAARSWFNLTASALSDHTVRTIRLQG